MIDTQSNDVLTGQKELQALVDWIEVWNRVCNAADPNDGPCPSWEEVVAQELPDWNMGSMTADGWDAYMKQTLYHEVENYLYAIGKHPTWPQPNPAEGVDKSQGE